MSSRHFHPYSEFVYAFLNPHFIRLSLPVQEAVIGYHHSFPRIRRVYRLSLRPLK